MTEEQLHETDVRLSLLEERVRFMERSVEELKKAIAGMNSKLTAILVSVATAAVLLAINLLVRGWGTP